MGLRSLPQKSRRLADRLPAGSVEGGLPIGRVIGPWLRSLRLDEQARLGKLLETWGAVMGKAVAAHTRPGRLNGRELVVYVDSSVWLSELRRYAQREMLANLRKVTGLETIQTVRLQLDPDNPSTGARRA